MLLDCLFWSWLISGDQDWRRSRCATPPLLQGFDNRHSLATQCTPVPYPHKTGVVLGLASLLFLVLSFHVLRSGWSCPGSSPSVPQSAHPSIHPHSAPQEMKRQDKTSALPVDV
ncbi:hypothetical protein BJX76DRAFT_189496 [Aspergillus varians]